MKIGFRVVERMVDGAGRKPRYWGEHSCQLMQYSAAALDGRKTCGGSHPFDRPILKKAGGGDPHYDA